MTRTKIPPTSSSTDRTTQYALDVVGGREVAGPHVRDAAERHLDDLKRGHERGLKFDAAAAERIFEFFETVLQLSEGQFEGKAFELHPSQAFILGSIFGWKRPDGNRRFRRAYIEQGKGNGKSPLAGGIGLFCQTADGEAGAEIYAAGARKEQAGILFRDAVKMVRKSPALAKRLQFSGGPGREYNIAHHSSGSFFRPISKEAGKTGSGPRPHVALCDEVHEHPDRSTMEMLERGFKFRRQPLLLMITNSGSDRNSICWEEHEHAIRVARRDIEDDTTFSFVCGLDQARTEVYPFDVALRHAVESCSCNVQITPTALPSPQDFAALATRESEGRKISPEGSDASITPTARLFLDAFATLATRGSEKSGTRSIPLAAANIIGPTLRTPSGQRTAASETDATESERSNRTRHGKLTARGLPNTGSLPSKLSKSEPLKVEDAASAVTKSSASGWITATLRQLYADSSVIPAMQESVCSEIVSRLYSAHSTTCGVRQRFHCKSGHLTADLPADDPLNDPSCWVKANPLLGVTITEAYLAGVVSQAKAMPGKLNGVMRLHFCVWTDAEDAWIGREALEAVLADFDPSEHFGKEIDLGLDLSGTKDLTAKACMVQTGEIEVLREDGSTILKPTFDAWIEAWTPAQTLAERALADRAPYDVWVAEGYLKATPGPTVRMDFVASSIAEDDGNFIIRTVAYDRYAYRKLTDELDALGLTLNEVEHPQGGKRRARPTDAEIEAAKANDEEPPEGLWMPGSLNALEELILEGRIRLRRNPVLVSACASAAIEHDPFDNRWFSKRKATQRIDPLVALAMATGAATRTTAKEQSVYEDRGLLFF